MVPIIPRNTYPAPPVGYARYRVAKVIGHKWIFNDQGQVPIWNSINDGAGPEAAFHVLIVRVCPYLEVILVGDRINNPVPLTDAISTRRDISKWPARILYFSHLAYLPPPAPKRRNRPRKAYDEDYWKLSWGGLWDGRRMRLLMLVPFPRLKAVIKPATQPRGISRRRNPSPSLQPHLMLDVDCTKQQLGSILDFMVAVAKLRPETQHLIHRALGHLAGQSYVNALDYGLNHLGGTSVRAFIDESNLWRKPAEDFKPVRWLAPLSLNANNVANTWLSMSRFPMPGSWDGEVELRPLHRIRLGLDAARAPVPVRPFLTNECFCLQPDRSRRAVTIAWVLNALSQHPVFGRFSTPEEVAAEI
jgi:hypothetical protein